MMNTLTGGLFDSMEAPEGNPPIKVQQMRSGARPLLDPFSHEDRSLFLNHPTLQNLVSVDHLSTSWKCSKKIRSYKTMSECGTCGQ